MHIVKDDGDKYTPSPSLAMLTYPSVHDVGIDAVLQGYCSNGRARIRACLNNLLLEFRAV